MARDYYSDEHFGRECNEEISLWKFYNFLTAANKSSYIDLLLPRAANASAFVDGVTTSFEHRNPHWFLS
ncbi:DUF3871 family protein [Flavisolibacter nicotianae]|uniref:DUF3871 family protein n=1 Tax=Flavisolibacter nicotianae TaxID=2364882 RepID=UPI000EB2C2A2